MHAPSRGRRRDDGVLSQLLGAEARAQHYTREQVTAYARRRGETWREAIRLAKDRCTRNQQLVRTHDDLAKRVVSVLGLASLRQWNGYIPPERLAEPGTGVAAPVNDSTIRAELVDVLAEATRRHGGD